MRDLLFVPIEPLEERYTEQWYRNFPLELSKHFNVFIVDGTPLENTIKVGSFLDINSTTHYKWTQLQTISRLFHQKQIKDGTIFFFADMEFWGLESIRLLAQMNNVDIKITAFLHAASYTIGDAFSIAAPYQKYTEIGWASVCDLIFVGSAYHKEAFIERRVRTIAKEQENYFADKIKVTLNPLFEKEFPIFDTVKKRKVLLTNRLDKEKNPLRTLQLFSIVKPRYPDVEFVVTSSRSELRGDSETIELAKTLESAGIITIKVGLSKREYYKELSEALIMVSHSPEENYGYCIAEALHYNVIPLLANSGSHPEFVGQELLFSNLGWSEDIYKLCVLLLDSLDSYRSNLKLDYSGLNNIIKELLSL